MGVFSFEQNRLRQQEIEVKALIALLEHGSHKMAVENRLMDYAIPERLAEKINKEVKGICCVVNCLNTHKDVEMVESGTGETIICVSCLERD